MTRPYRGKYPERIHTVSSIKGRAGMFVRLNNGKKMMIVPVTCEGRSRAPKPGDDIRSFPGYDYNFESFVPGGNNA
jgi:hypothetical protein